MFLRISFNYHKNVMEKFHTHVLPDECDAQSHMTKENGAL